MTRVFDPHVKFVKMKVKKSNRTKRALHQFWYVGIGISIPFFSYNSRCIAGKCQEEIQLRTSLLNLQNGRETWGVRRFSVLTVV